MLNSHSDFIFISNYYTKFSSDRADEYTNCSTLQRLEEELHQYYTLCLHVCGDKSNSKLGEKMMSYINYLNSLRKF
jgi:hypothetical protein